MSINLKIAKAYIILVFASILGHIISLGKDMVVANCFGVSKMLDAFYAALTVPNMLFNIISQPFVVVFIPLYIQYKLNDREESARVASILINCILIILFTITVLIFAFSSETITLFGFNFPNAETNAMTVNLLRFLSLIILLSGLITVFTGLLNSYEDFRLPAYSQMIVTVSIIALIWFFSKKYGIYAYALGSIIGLFIQLILLIIGATYKGYRYYPILNLNHPKIKKILRTSLHFIGAGLPATFVIPINRIMASWLPSGSIAAMGYADKLVQMPMIIFSGSIATAVYPFFSTQAAENKIEDLKNSLTTAIKMTGFIFIPLAVTMIVLSKPTIQLLFERGAFDAQATGLTSIIFICYSFQLFSIYAMVIMIRAVLVFRDMTSIFIINISSLLLTVIFNYVFMKIINPPAAGIALSTSLVCFIATIFYFFFLKKRVSGLHGIQIIKSLIKTAILAFISGAAVFISFKILDSSIGFSIIKQLIKLSASSIIGIIFFAGLAFLLKIEEAEKIYAVVKTKLQNTLKVARE